MKLRYLEPKAEVRCLLGRDIIAASDEVIEPGDNPPNDAVEDPF